MDRVRLGRVLGRGARMAAQTAVEAVQAAAAPEPAVHETAAPSQGRTSPPRPTQPTILPPQRPAATSARAVQAASAARAGMAAPLKTASKALWHEVTGSFFALFAASFAIAVWHTRASALSDAPQDRYRFYAFCAFALLFAYFSASSFVRARKRT